MALQLADQAPAQNRGERGADRSLNERDVGAGQEDKVRRMAIQCNRVRSSYIVAATSARVDAVPRASTER